MKKLSKILSIALCLAMVLGLFTFGASAATVTDTYTFGDYTAGTQYAENEPHVLDSNVTVTTTQCHFTSELRIYSSTSHNGFAIIKSENVITKFGFNAGNKVDTLNVYGSTNGSSYTLIQGVSITSTSYNDYSVTIPANSNYKYLKLDVAGDQQVRVKSFSISYEGVCTHGQKAYNTDAENHTEKCASCGEVTGTPQAHTYTNNPYKCDVCSYIKYPAADSTLTLAEAINLANAHNHDKYSSNQYIVTGKITSIDEEYSTQFNNITVTISDEQGNSFKLYRLAGEGADALAVGDVIAAKGPIGRYNSSVQIKNGTLIILCDHTDFTWASDEDSHWKVCSNTDCGKIFDECTETPVVDKNETQHWTKCDCGYESTKTNHDFGTEYKLGENGHYQECECGQKTTEEDHADGTDEDELCDKCGLNMACPHTTWKENHDKDNHWLECDACEAKKDVTKHTLTTEHDKDNHWTECECGYASEEVKHTMNTKHDDKKHWSECECGYATEKADHKFTGIKCECGFENAVGADYAKFPISKPSDIKPGYYILGGNSVNSTADGNTYVYMGGEDDGSSRLNGIGLTGKNGTINAKDASNIWEFIAVEGGFKIKNVGTGKYLYAKDNQNKVYLTENAAEAGVWKVIALEGGWGLQDTATERCLGANRYGKEGSYYLGFAAYKVSQYVPCLLDLYTINDGSFKPAPNTGDGISAVVALLAVSGMGLVVLTAKKKED